MKKHHIVMAVLISGLVLGFSVLLYPYVGAYINAMHQTRAVARYIDDVATTDKVDLQAILADARIYNEALLRKPDRFVLTREEMAQYEKLLDIGQDVMGILTIEKINVNLPIYHGTDEGVLQVGLGHMPGTSLPVGGAGTHAFITGHRGVPSSILLSDLDKLAEGDVFVIYVMGESLAYRVDQISTVEPHAVRELDIDPDMDYCTLVTCTPYGVNTHRLLVRGQRTQSDAGWNELHADVTRLDTILVLPLFMIPVLPFILLYLVLRYRKIR